jgi:phosphopantothenoylcysteine synthetase/decarboxylase
MLSVIVCGAGPASDVGKLVKLAQQRGWSVQLIATPAALAFLDIVALEAIAGSAVRSAYRSPSEPRSEKADAVIVAPATYNTINKCAQGSATPMHSASPRPSASHPGCGCAMNTALPTGVLQAISRPAL